MFESPEKPAEPKNKIETLKEKGIVSFDVGLTPEERECIEKMEIREDLPEFLYYGPGDEQFVQAVAAHLSLLEGNDKETTLTVARLIGRVVEQARQDLHKESAYTIVRVTIPNDLYDIPRWHQDGYYWPEEEGAMDPERKQYKLVWAVKSDQTRFARILDKQRYKELELEAFENAQLNESTNPELFEKRDREIRRELMGAVEEIESTNEGMATLYLVGHEDAQVHSEPPMRGPRIFMSTVPGSKKEIEWRKNYKK